MEQTLQTTIRIAAALIDDGAGRILLVRKFGTEWFMQAGGKIEKCETALSALRRELVEEIGLVLEDKVDYLGCFSAPAANEPHYVVVADLFHIRVQHTPLIQAEIAEAIWVDLLEATALPLAPLTRNHVLPIASKLNSDERTRIPETSASSPK
jgi:8-oxo-dGTP pyrophosphatase MutT (NUDIX family)